MTNNKELLRYNQAIFNSISYKYGKQEYFQLGFFNGNQILFLGINPGVPYTKELKEHVKTVMKQTTFIGFQENYEKVIKVTRMGAFMKEIVGDDWSKIGLTNIVKIATFQNKEPSTKMIEEFLPVTKKQIELLQPKIILCMGKFVSSFFKLDSFYSSEKIDNCYYLSIPHPSYLFRKGLVDAASERIKILINLFLKKCAKDSLERTQLTLSI